MSQIAQIPDHGDGDEFTQEMWTALEGNINDGIVTQRACKLHRTGDKAIASGASVTIDFDVIDVDTDGMYDAASPTRITFKTAGMFGGVASIQFSGDASGTNREVRITKNGTTDISRNSRGPRDASHSVNVACAFEDYFNVGDYIEVVAAWDATAAGTVNSVTEYGNYVRVSRR